MRHETTGVHGMDIYTQRHEVPCSMLIAKRAHCDKLLITNH